MLFSAAKFERATSSALTSAPTRSTSTRSDCGAFTPQYTGKFATTSGPYAPSASSSTWYFPRPRSQRSSPTNSLRFTRVASVVHFPSASTTSSEGRLRFPSSRPLSTIFPPSAI